MTEKHQGMMQRFIVAVNDTGYCSDKNIKADCVARDVALLQSITHSSITR